MTRLFLVRHAQALRDSQADDVPLSELGQKQAALVGQRLGGEEIHLLLASPLIRARQTAETISSFVKAPVIEQPGLEELNWRVWYKRGHWPFDEARGRVDEIENLDQQQATLRQFQKKALGMLDQIYKEYRDQSLAITTHGNVIRSILTGILGAGVTGFLSLEMANTGLSLVTVDQEGHAKIIFINDYCHLKPL